MSAEAERGSDAVERAQTALDGITPGPWITFPGWHPEIHQEAAPDRMVALAVVRSSKSADAAFIAAAPTLVADLLAVIDRLERWKAEGMTVLGDWERVYEAAGSPGTLGESKAAAVLALVQRLTTPTEYPSCPDCHSSMYLTPMGCTSEACSERRRA